MRTAKPWGDIPEFVGGRVIGHEGQSLRVLFVTQQDRKERIITKGDVVNFEVLPPRGPLVIEFHYASNDVGAHEVMLDDFAVEALWNEFSEHLGDEKPEKIVLRRATKGEMQSD